MKFRLLSLSSLIAVSLVGASHADLIGHWKFDEGEGEVAADSSADC